MLKANRAKPSRRFHYPFLEELETRELPANISLLTPQFDGLNRLAAGGSEPPDTNLAVGPTAVIEIVNFAVAFAKKSDGTPLGNPLNQSLAAFFSSLNPTFLVDPVVTYDELVGKFVICSIDLNFTAQISFIDFALSNDSNPAHGFTFNQYSVGEIANGISYFGDFDRLGWNGDAWVITVEMSPFGVVGSYLRTQELAIDKNNRANFFKTDVTPPQLQGAQFSASLVPAIMHGAIPSTPTQPGTPLWMVQQYGDGLNLQLVLESNVLSNQPSFTVFTVNLPSQADYLTTVPHPLQPNGQQVTKKIDSRILSVAFRSNELVVSHNIGTPTGGVAHARWYRIDVTSLPPRIAEWNDINPGTGFYTYYPAIDINVVNGIAISFMQSANAPSDYESVWVVAKLATDPLNTGAIAPFPEIMRHL